MAVMGLGILMALLFLYEYERIRRYGGGAREVIVFSVAMGFAAALTFAVILRLPVPNPTHLIEAIFGPAGRWFAPVSLAGPWL